MKSNLVETYEHLMELAQKSLLRMVAGKDGSLYFEGGEDPATIHFDVLGRSFVAMSHQMGLRWTVTVAANLGPVPYSAENAQGRANVMQIINDSANTLAPHGSLYISPTQQVVYSGVTQEDGPLTTPLLLEILGHHVCQAHPFNALLDKYRGIAE